MNTHILAIDQGTTSSRAIVFDASLKPLTTGQEEFSQHFPHSGWVEHDPEDIWSTTIAMCRKALALAQVAPTDLAAIGITNQRETTLVWDRDTGRAIYNAIVWQDRRTTDICKTLKEAGHEPMVAEKTGLLLDPYFSATKLAWILDNVEGARTKAEAGNLLFGTVDSFLIWRLSGGERHVTDATNAARTMLYNINSGDWDADLLSLFNIPACILPTVQDNAAEFGVTRPDFFEGAQVPIRGVAGDQQAATVGQACFAPGMMKSTYGTGCFALLNTGSTPVQSQNRMLTTIAYQLSGQPTYALEGSIFVAGSVVQWLRDGLKIIPNAAETQPMAERANPAENVIFVPAFTGLGAPYWNADCRGAIFNLTRNTGPEDIARAALQSVAFQTRDLVEAMTADWDGAADTILRVDGGMAASDWTMQALADQMMAPVDRPVMTETTALGAAYLAGLQSGLCPDPEEFARAWALERRFEPGQGRAAADQAYAHWKTAISKLLYED